jgi:pyruvate/2-oxoglutarate dehydrogenase complex dihydrolipoamide acyltransferase (E2) component
MKKRELFSKFNKMSEDEISKELANLYAEARKTRLDIESKTGKAI